MQWAHAAGPGWNGISAGTESPLECVISMPGWREQRRALIAFSKDSGRPSAEGCHMVN